VPGATETLIVRLVVRFPAREISSQLIRLFCTDALIENEVGADALTVNVCAWGALPPTLAVKVSELTLAETRDSPEPSSAIAAVQTTAVARSGTAARSLCFIFIFAPRSRTA